MDARYATFRAFEQGRDAVSAYARRLRSETFRRTMSLRRGMRVLDLGGQPRIWDMIPEPMHITILNLPGEAEVGHENHHELTFVEGDACNVRLTESFDLVFSNSVIEHVGDADAQAAFAREVRRLAPDYWVQTPSIWFPVEAHCGMPFWWFYPERVREALLERWERKLPAWTDMVRGTTVLSRKQLESLFPDAQIISERTLGLEKSLIAYRRSS